MYFPLIIGFEIMNFAPVGLKYVAKGHLETDISQFAQLNKP